MMLSARKRLYFLLHELTGAPTAKGIHNHKLLCTLKKNLYIFICSIILNMLYSLQVCFHVFVYL